jgi:hypothetical protein
MRLNHGKSIQSPFSCCLYCHTRCSLTFQLYISEFVLGLCFLLFALGLLYRWWYQCIGLLLSDMGRYM